MKEINYDLEYYNYDLPQVLIAQKPIKNRCKSRLLIVNKDSNNIKHDIFENIVDYLTPNDVLVLNNTKVLPARIYGVKEKTSAKIEILLLHEIKTDLWQCLVKHQKRLKKGTQINFDNRMTGIVKKISDSGVTNIEFKYNGVFLEILDLIGVMPLPPYIHSTLKDKKRYQTVYASVPGSVAAPTAGLHFTEDLLMKIKAKGVEVLNITLNVGLGTFRPVNEKDIRLHKMHSEYYEINEETAKQLNEAKKNSKRIICVGTTSMRTLEANIQKYGVFKSTCENTNIFIYPPYKFKAADALITNFHLPKSTLLMLVSAFASRDIILNAYNNAIKEKYKFFSFGDAMFIKGE